MKILVRKYVKNRDKHNEMTEDGNIELALKMLGKDFKDIYREVYWLHYVDLFFTDTNDYLRIINN